MKRDLHFSNFRNFDSCCTRKPLLYSNGGTSPPGTRTVPGGNIGGHHTSRSLLVVAVQSNSQFTALGSYEGVRLKQGTVPERRYCTRTYLQPTRPRTVDALTATVDNFIQTTVYILLQHVVERRAPPGMVPHEQGTE